MESLECWRHGGALSPEGSVLTEPCKCLETGTGGVRFTWITARLEVRTGRNWQVWGTTLLHGTVQRGVRPR